MKHYFIFFSLVVVALGITFVVRGGYYPVASVGGSFLFARDFQEQYRAVLQYYSHATEVYGVSSTSPRSDVEGAVLEGLIESALVHKEIEKEMGKTAETLVTERVQSVVEEDSKLAQAAEVVYGFNAQEFRRMVLIPQAEREILIGQLFLKGEDFSKWLAEAKQNNRILLFSPGFTWTGTQVKKVP